MRTIDLRSAGRLTVAFTALLIVVAACTSSGGGADTSGGTAASPAPAVAASAAAGGGKYTYGEEDEYGATATKAPAAGGEAVVVNVANGASGTYLAGADGRTLYIFKKDSGTTSACLDACAGNWPPLIAATPTAGDGVGGALTTFARPDGSMQVAYDGAPLYYYAGDTAAGDTKGQGMGEVWFIATP